MSDRGVEVEEPPFGGSSRTWGRWVLPGPLKPAVASSTLAASTLYRWSSSSDGPRSVAHGPVAQWSRSWRRAPLSKGGGREFDSHRGHASHWQSVDHVRSASVGFGLRQYIPLKNVLTMYVEGNRYVG